MNLADKLRELKVIPVVAINRAEDAVALANTLIDSGLPAIEITFRTEAAAAAIREIKQHCPQMYIGAGTVLTGEQVQAAKAAGADFIVSPGFNPTTVKACQAAGLPIIPGVNNPMAIEAALEMGITLVKFFPAEASGGVKMLKALLAPYSMLQVMPTGGIEPNNIGDYLAIPQVVACGGTWFVKQADIDGQQWQKIAELTTQAVQLVK